MAAELVEYKASLKGVNSTEFCINKLLSYAGPKVIVEEEKHEVKLQFIAPIKEMPDLSETEAALTKRARDLRWNVPDLVKKTALDIHLTYMAEQIVNEGVLSVWLPKCQQNATAELILAIMPAEDPMIAEICDFYASIRILEVVNALDMTLDRNVCKIIP